MYWGKQRFIQVLIFDKFWYCFLIMGLEYLRLKILLFNFYSNWKGKKNYHGIAFFGDLFIIMEKPTLLWKKNQIFEELQVKKTSLNALDILRGAPTSICHFFCPCVRLSVRPFVCPSVRLFVTHHILGTVHHMIFIFGTHV